MRSLAPTLLLAAALVPAAVRAEEEIVRLKVGETKPGVGTVRPICDAPSVAVIEGGVLRAVGPGETLCAASPFQAQGTRRLYRVVVTPANAPRDGGGAGAAKGDAGAPAR